MDLIHFQSELAEDGLELMAMDMWTPPTSLNFIPKPQNLDFGAFCSCMCYVFHVSWNPKPCFSNSAWKISKGSRLERCRLKCRCVPNRSYFSSVDRQFKSLILTFVDHQSSDTCSSYLIHDIGTSAYLDPWYLMLDIWILGFWNLGFSDSASLGQHPFGR